jgi:hypothetical protein
LTIAVLLPFLDFSNHIANERIINSLKESIKKNDVFEKVKIDKIYKDDLKNQEMVVKQQLSKSINH